VIKACVVLHNFLKSEAEKGNDSVYCPPGYADRIENGEIVEGEWRREASLEHSAFGEIERSMNRNYSHEAFTVRETFVDYFSTVGSVPWQAERAGINEIYDQ